MNEIYASKNNVLNIGFMGEDNRTRVHFPVGDLQAEYPGCSFVLLIKRAGDDGVYVVEPVISGDEALWTVEDGFLANKGEGEAVLICSTGTVTAKRKAWKTWTDYSLSGGVTPPADFSTWVTELLQAGADVQAAVDAFNEITAEATEGEQTSAYIDRTGDHPVLKITIRSGGGAVDSVNGKTGVVSLNASDVHALPDSTSIPVVDSDLSGTSTNAIQNKVVKNALDQKANSTTVSQLSETIVNLSNTVSGKYAKPSGGIPSTDMSEAVQTSLGKANTALQEHQDVSGKQNKPAAAGTAGQVLGLDANLAPVWKNPFPTNYELVVDVTTEETLAAINILTDINNNPLNLSTMMMVITTPGYQNPTGTEGYLRTSYIDDNNQSHPFIIQTRIRSSNSVSLVWTERFGDYILTGATAAYEETEAWATSTNYYSRVMVNTDAIHGVSIEKYNSSSYDIPSGTRIQIYGVRA